MEFIDHEKYPIDNLESDACQKLVQHCREELKREGSVCLAGFIKQDLIAKMAEEVSSLESHNRCEVVTPYIFVKEPANAGPTHPFHKKIVQDLHAVAADAIPQESMLMQVYDSAKVMQFLAALLGEKEIHQFDDEFQKINVMYMRDGGSRAWHYDGSDFVITLLLQTPEQGGEFEYAPFIRGENGEENFDDVAKLFAGQFPTKSNRAEAGTLQLFSGRRSMHRVRAVYGAKQRIQTVLSYDRLPGQRSPEGKNVALYGKRVANILATRSQKKRKVASSSPRPPMSPMSPMKKIGRGCGKISALSI